MYMLKVFGYVNFKIKVYQDTLQLNRLKCGFVLRNDIKVSEDAFKNFDLEKLESVQYEI